MKLSDGFDARRLRPSERKSWGRRLIVAIAALLAVIGVLLIVAGGASLAGYGGSLGALAARDAALTALVLGLVLIAIAMLLWRWCRRRLRRSSELSLSPGLMKRRD
ncbi:hypothetical protein C211_02176 [Stutzerimonas degradans]|nr:hypothetical protein C211_12067 [Stutzerimonas degradans]EKM97562.1 hypothetical protein C211_02176 [Stutzerimonas degradans]